MLKEVVFASDFHVPHHDKRLFAAWLNMLADRRPDYVILGGDVSDFGSVSSHGDAKGLLIDELNALGGFLDLVQDAAGRLVEIKFVEGNHEDRLRKYIERLAPALAHFPGLDLASCLDLKNQGISFHPYGDLVSIGDLNFTHGAYAGQNHAQMHLSRFGCNIVYGHTHRPQTYVRTLHNGRMQGAWGQGCMAPLSANYIKGRPTGWAQSFFHAYVEDDGSFHPTTVMCKNGSFVLNGKRYR